MTISTVQGRALALAGLFQSASLVNQLAKTGLIVFLFCLVIFVFLQIVGSAFAYGR